MFKEERITGEEPPYEFEARIKEHMDADGGHRLCNRRQFGKDSILTHSSKRSYRL